MGFTCVAEFVGGVMLKKQFAGVLILVALQAAAEDWTASIETIHAGTYLPPTPSQFSHDARGFHETLLVPGNPAFRKIGYGPTGREYETLPFPTFVYITVDLAGSSDTIAWVVEDNGPNGGSYPVRLYVEKQGEIQPFNIDGSPADYAVTKAYIGRVSLSDDGSVVTLPTSVCGDCDGQVEAWKLNEANQYQQVISHKPTDGRPNIGLAAASSTNRVVSVSNSGTVLNEASEEIIQTTVSIYNIADGSVLTEASEEITLVAAQFGYPSSGSSIDISQNGATLAVVMRPGSAYPNSPTPSGGVVVFSKPQPCILQCGWSQKGQVIDAAPSLAGFAYAYETAQVLLSEDGNTAAVVTHTDCYASDGGPSELIDPCHSGLITIWDFNSVSDLWEERKGDGLPIAVPVPDPTVEHFAGLSGFDAQRGVLGISVIDDNEENFTLMKVTLEESSATGLPIWLLYEASQ